MDLKEIEFDIVVSIVTFVREICGKQTNVNVDAVGLIALLQTSSCRL